MSNVLFIDGRNFITKLHLVFDGHAKSTIDFAHYNFRGLMNKVLQGISIDQRLVYLGKLLVHKGTEKKSKELIEKQRVLKTHLEHQGFKAIIAGRVRGHLETCPKGHRVLTFKEKGIDVKMAVDMTTLACDQRLKVAIIGSSDSDLQPAIRELTRRGVLTIYLGFEDSPNKGLTFTAKKTILIRNSEVLEFLP